MVGKEKDKEKEKADTTNGVKPVDVEKAVARFVAEHFKLESLREEFSNLEKMTVKDEEHVMCCHHKDLIRNPDIPCLEKTRVLLEPEDDDSCDFIHANKISFENYDRKYTISEAPMNENVENFWRMIFQNHSTTVVVLGKSEIFWPMNEGKYKNYGNMFVNNKRNEDSEFGTTYTIEVLPEGCSDAIITKIHHLADWESHRRPNNVLNVLNLMRSINTETNPITVVSNYGIHRSTAFVLSEVVIASLLKGIPTKLLDVAVQLRKQRARAFSGAIVCYFSAALIVAAFIGDKFPKYTAAYEKLLHDNRIGD